MKSLENKDFLRISYFLENGQKVEKKWAKDLGLKYF